MITGRIFDIRRYSIHDGPGIRTTVFLKGCPLRCVWCHNPEGQSAGPEIVYREARCIRCGACAAACPQRGITVSPDAVTTEKSHCLLCGTCATVCYAEARELVGRDLTVSEVVTTIERDRPFFEESRGGVTLSGGEPLRQIEFLEALLDACRERGLHSVVDTCGFAAWSALDRIRAKADAFLYDLKLMDDVRHREFTAGSNAPILDNLRRLAALHRNIRVRVPIIPGINDDDANLRRIGAFVRTLPGVTGIDLLPYHRIGAEKYPRLDREYSLPELQPPPPEHMAHLGGLLQDLGLTVHIGTS